MGERAQLAGKRIRQLREQMGKTQKEIAEMVGTTAPNMNFYENGKRSPSFDSIVKFAQFFGVSTDYLLGASDIKGIFCDEEVSKAFEGFVKLSPRDRLVIMEMIRVLQDISKN